MTMPQVCLILFALAAFPLTTRAGIPHKGGQHEREDDGAFSPRDVHHHSHDEGGHEHHNAQFDHESILGSSKDAKEFDQLPPEEAKKRLSVLLSKMDRNKDKKITKDELHQWIVRSFRSLSQEESGERFKDADTDGDGSVSWMEYKTEEFDLDLDDDDDAATEERLRLDPDRQDEFSMLQEDKILFDSADKDGDGRLNKAEFLSFSHPEEDKEMHEVVLMQVLKQKDMDGDGLVSFQEYVGERAKDQTKEWLVEEKDRFDSELDKNKDGSLDRAEVLEWMIPSNDEIAKDEVNHLFAGSDDDADGELTFEEVLANHELFVGSEATDYGEHLQNLHRFQDEL